MTSMEPVLAMVRGGPTDEHRFVGLLMLPKLLEQLEQGGTRSPESRGLAFAALDMGFLGRLLASAGDKGESAAQMRAVALSVLAAFADEPQFGGAALVLAPRIAQAWAAEAGQHAGAAPVDLAVARDAASLLVGLSRSGEAALALAASGGGAAVLSLLVALDSRGREAEGSSEQLDALLRSIGRALSALLTAAEVEARTNAGPGLVDSVGQTVRSISAVLGSAQSLLKFISLGLLAPSVMLLQTACDTACALPESASGPWVAQAREGLRSILGARVGASQRYDGLLAVAMLTDFLGPEWLASSGSGGGTSSLRRLVVRLTSVEMQLLLEDDRSSAETQPQDSEVRAGDLLSVCLRLAEQAVLYAQSLTAPQESSSAGAGEMSPQEATDMAGDCVRSAAQWAARLIAGEQTLAPLLALPHQPEATSSSESGLAPEPEPEPEPAEQEMRKVSLLLGGVRLIGCWAAAAEPQLELARLFPYFLEAAWTSGDGSKAGDDTIVVQASEQSAFDFLYPALLQLSIVSPISRQWLFGNFDVSEKIADSAVAAVARQIVRCHNSGGPTVGVLDPRRLELLLNILCLEHTIPLRVTATIGSTVVALTSHLTQLMGGSQGMAGDWGLAMAVVAAGVRLVRDSSNLRGGDDCLSDVTQPGCSLVLRWLAATYHPAVASLEETAGTEQGVDGDGEQLAEMYLLTSGVCCSLLDDSGNGSDSNRRHFVAKALRDAARHSDCAKDLGMAMKAAAKQPLHKSLPVKEDEDETDVSSADISESLVRLAQLLSGPDNQTGAD